MEPRCKLEDFGGLAQLAVSNRLRCRAKAVSERYSVRNPCAIRMRSVFGLCMAKYRSFVFNEKLVVHCLRPPLGKVGGPFWKRLSLPKGLPPSGQARKRLETESVNGTSLFQGLFAA